MNPVEAITCSVFEGDRRGREHFERNTRAVWKVRGLAAVHRCYAFGGGDCCAKLY